MKKKEQKNLLAPEQYELHASREYQFSMNRRRFFHVLGSGVAIAFTVGNSIASSLTETAPEDQLAAWIHINEEGVVKIYTGKAEVGQNIRTSLA